MTDTAGDLEIRIGYGEARFNQSGARIQQSFNRTARSVESRARQLDTRLASTGSRFGRSFGSQIQNVGFQVGDFATQVAGGTSAVTALTQQGTQLLGAFGPIGSVLGAVGAVAGALAVSLLNVDDAADGATGSAEALANALDGLEATGNAVDDLNARIEKSSGEVRAALILERDATIRLLKARAELARTELAAASAGLDAQARATVIEDLPDQRQLGRRRSGSEQRRAAREGRISELLPDARTAVLDADPKLAAELAEANRKVLEFDNAISRLNADPAATVSATGGGAGRRRSSGTGARQQRDQFGDSVGKINERIAVLQVERQQIGLNERASAQLEAAFEREKLSRELIASAQKDGTPATAEEIALAQNLAAEVETLTIAIFDEAEALEAASEAAKKAKKDQDDLAKSISQTGNNFIRAVQSAESFEDALKKIGLQLLELAANAAIGQGPLGGLFNDLIGVSANGLVGLLGSGGTPLPQTSPLAATGGFFAKGAPFMGGQVVPFARGGIVSGPMTFPMKGATGLMGEAGPEAIIPLKRGPDGKLGVASQGSGGKTIHLTVHNNVSGLGASLTQVQTLLDRNNKNMVAILDERLNSGYGN